MRLKVITGILLAMLLLVVVAQAGVSVGVVDFDGESGDFMAQSSVDWWPMFHHDLSHTGYSTSTAPNTNSLRWTYATGSYVFSSPAVAGGKVYVGSCDNNVYCLDAPTGSYIWSYTTGDRVQSSPAVAGGKVYVGSCDNNVYCLSASTGSLIWSYTTGNRVDSPPAVADGKVYVGSMDQKVYCLSASTGSYIWSYTTGGGVGSSPAVVGGRVYVGSCDNKVYCLDASTGSYIWSYTTGLWVSPSSPAVADGKVYVGSWDKKVYCLDASTGAFIWSYTTGEAVYSSPAVAGGKVYVGSWDNKVYCLSASTGSYIWSYTTGGTGGVWSSPAVAGGKVYVGSYDNKVYCLSASTGSYIWSYTTGGPVESSPAVADGRVYIGGSYHDDNKVYCFGPYDITIKAHCYTEGIDVSVNITMDGTPTGYSTPHTFTGLTGTHTFTVPNTDPSGHSFKNWSTGENSTTITVSSGGTYTAYYEQPPVPDFAEETISNYIQSADATGGGDGWPDYAWNSGYDTSFANQTLHIEINIRLVGDDPGDALRQQWELGIEDIWSNSYDIVDGTYTYPILVEVNWVSVNPHHTVHVHDMNATYPDHWINMLNWYTQIPHGAEYQDQVAAHEAGHMLGLYDEYAEPFTDTNNNGRYDLGEPFTDNYQPPNGIWDCGALDPDTWFITTNSLMADLGPTRSWHYEQILEWLETKSGRDLSLAQSPLPPYPLDDPIPNFTDPQPPYTPPPPVGGVWVPVDKFALLAPYIALASTLLVATVAVSIYVKRVKRRK